MMLIHSLDSPLEFKNPVVTIGTFDGVHTGHMAVISHLIASASALGGESVVITFSPHPRKIISGSGQKLSLLTTSDEKIALLERTGIAHLIIIDFDKELSMMDACDFVEHILVRKLRARHLIVGFNHHFGRRGEGDFNTIRQCGARFDLSVEMVSAVGSGSGTVSSSVIRDALLEGRLEDANSMLGYCYSINGKVVEGRRIGRSIGFPTVNIDPYDSEKLIPRTGVYAAGILLDNNEYKGVMNIGYNPTVNSESAVRTIEAYIFDFDKEVYGSEITAVLKFRLRDEMKFPGLVELAAQIELDKKKALSLMG
jgi:riboflavin kinase / FMN adenylyltransferase